MIEVKKLTKKYGANFAVNNISFVVYDGEILGFLGPNGAGKTTTMNMLTGFISSTSGTVRINGYDIVDDPINAKKQLGYMPDVPPLYGDMTVMEYLHFVCDIKKIKKDKREEMLEKITSLTGIEKMKGRLCKNLSKGYRQRVGLAQALVGFPEVLILDEPTSGLDPEQIVEIREVIKELGKDHTVILSSHILSEVSAICDRVMIINNGKIVATDSTEKLSEGSDAAAQLLSVPSENAEEALEALKQKDGIMSATLVGQGKEAVLKIESSGEDIRKAIFSVMSEKNIPILKLQPSGDGLEEAFMRIIRGENEQPDPGFITEEDEPNDASEKKGDES